MGQESSSERESTFVGVLGGGFGDPPVKVADLEAAARRRTAARRMLAAADDEASDVEDFAQLGEN